tara:strand:+ start:749 stop:949 length:201 start_codon:yes stop_codon:yes gene_type:complete
MTQNYTDLNKERSLDENLSSKEIKTTDVNILLNRVRLDKKKTFRKNILVSLLIAGLVCSIAIYFTI